MFLPHHTAVLAHTPHLALQLLTLLVRTLLFLLFSWENVADLLTKHVPRAVLDKLAGMMGYTFPDAETQKYQEYTNINQNNWDQKLAAVERLPVFDDGENMYRSFFLDGWSDRAVRWENARF